MSFTVEKITNFSQFLFFPPVARIGKDALQIRFKQVAGVLQILFGVCFCRPNGRKRLVQNGDDSLLFGERRERDFDGLVSVAIQIANARGVALHPFGDAREMSPMQKLVEKTEIQLMRIADSKSSSEIAKREITFCFIEKSNSPYWLL